MLRKADAWGKHLFHHYEGGARRARPPRPVRQVHRARRCRSPSPSARCGCGWSAPSTAPTCAGPTACEVIDAGRGRRHRRPARPRPAAPRRRPVAGLGANHQVPQGDRRAADGPEGDRRGRQRLPQRAAVPPPHRPAPARHATSTTSEFDDAWTDLVALMKVGVRRGKIVTMRPEDDHGAAVVRARPAAHLRLPARRRSVPGLRHADPHRGDWRRATCSGARPARPDARSSDATAPTSRDNRRVELILVVVGAIVVTAVAHRRGLEPALIIVVIGIAVSFLPGLRSARTRLAHPADGGAAAAAVLGGTGLLVPDLPAQHPTDPRSGCRPGRGHRLHRRRGVVVAGGGAVDVRRPRWCSARSWRRRMR